MEKLVVFNGTPKRFSLEFKLPVPHGVFGMSKHISRRIVRDSRVSLQLHPKNSIDLVEATGLTVEEIEEQESFKHLIKQGFINIISRVVKEEEVVEEEYNRDTPFNIEGQLFGWFFEVKSVEDALIGEATYEDVEDLIKTPPRVIKGYYSGTSKKAGRPPGSKNKRKPGRPKKPKNAVKKPSGRKPGRPKGSKNKKKTTTKKKASKETTKES